jgi:hypothetical protein
LLAALLEVAAFLSLRSVAADVRIADCTSGRMWSSTLLSVKKKKKRKPTRSHEKGLPHFT